MVLTLTIIKAPPGVDTEAGKKTFGPAGGVLGRGRDNDWVLEDQERFLSSKHCQIEQDGDQFYLVDLSTNGTFVNGSGEPVGRGNRVPLNTGDQIDVGDYRFKVALEDTPAAGISDSPFDDFEPAKTATDIDLGGSSGAAPEAMFMSNEYAGAVSDIAPAELKVTDPLEALDKAAGRSGADAGAPEPADPFADDAYNPDDPFASDNPFAGPDPFAVKPSATDAESAPFGSQEDSADLLSEAAAWPEARQESSGVLPDDWDQDISILAKRKPQMSAHSLPESDSLIARRPESAPPAAKPAPRPAPKPAAKPKPGSRPAAKPAPAKARATRPAPMQPTQAPAAGGNLFSELGLDTSGLSEEQLEDISATVGLMMRETLQGLMQVLRSRTSIKNEFRMNVTTIQSVENNPLKFAVNVDELLDTMFVRRSKAYKEPVEAVQESLDSIADHQVAVIAGVRSAFRATIGQFDPNKLEDEFRHSGKGSKLPGLSGARYWSAYQDYYSRMVNNMERSFQELFGDEFVQAYEDQLRKLARARNRGGQ